MTVFSETYSKFTQLINAFYFCNQNLTICGVLIQQIQAYKLSKLLRVINTIAVGISFKVGICVYIAQATCSRKNLYVSHKYL